MEPLIRRLLSNLRATLCPPWSDQATFLDVFFAYRLLLRRRPEFQSQDHYKARSSLGLARLVTAIMQSEEFRRLWKVGADPLPDLEVMVHYGDRRYWFNLRDREIGHAIARGCYEPQVEALMVANLRSGMNVVDVGANVGFFSLLMGMLVGNGQVHACEPFPANYELLLRNIRENRLEARITAHQVAAYDEPGMDQLYFRADPYNDDLGSMFLSHTEHPGHSSINIHRTRIDDLVPRDLAIHCIKLDVEGSELLYGMERLVSALASNDFRRIKRVLSTSFG